MKENQNAIACANEVLAQIVRETPEISGLFSGVPVYVYSETDEDFAGRIEGLISGNTGVAVFVRNDGWENTTQSGGLIVRARFTVKIFASLLLNSMHSQSLTDLAVAITKNVYGSSGDPVRFRSEFIPEDASVYESGNVITRELNFSVFLEL